MLKTGIFIVEGQCVKSYALPSNDSPTPINMSNTTKVSYIFIVLCLYMLGYTVTQTIIEAGEYDFYTKIDSLIPLMPEFIWVYHSIIPVIITTAVGLVKDKNLFFTMFWSCLIISIVLNMSYMALPSFYPREDFAINNIHDYFLQLTRDLDGSHNTFPSGHVAFSWLMLLTALKTSFISSNRSMRFLYILWVVSVTVSTLTLKQHFIADVLAGIVLSYITFSLVNYLMSANSSLFIGDEISNAER